MNTSQNPGLDFEIRASAAPVPAAQRAEILAEPGFGRYFTDHMVRSTGRPTAAGASQVVPYGPISLDPDHSALHYGQEIFEGLKAYRQPDGSIATFRPTRTRPLPRPARLAMAELPRSCSSSRSLDLVRRPAWVPTVAGSRCTSVRS